MNWLRRAMYGRYGSDQLSIFLMVLYVLLSLLSGIFSSGILYYVSLVPIVFCVYRMISRNIYKRREENARFLELIGPLTRWFRLRRMIHRDKEHRYFKCPNCGQQLRVPRGKGKVQITCRSCGVSFEENS